MTEANAATARIAIAFGEASHARAQAIADALPIPLDDHAPALAAIDGPQQGAQVTVLGAGARAGPHGWAWSAAPLDHAAGDHPAEARLRDDAASLTLSADGRSVVRTGVSGALGVFVHMGGPRASAVSSSPGALVAAGIAPPTPDWDAWAELIASGGSLGSRTPFLEVRRLRPDTALVVDATGGALLEAAPWEFSEEASTRTGDLSPIADALEAAVDRLAGRGPLRTMLSGGWDSRVLSSLARRHDPTATGWTTSKDSGTAWEELMARRVALELGYPHHLVQPDARRFTEDLDDYAHVVDHQTPYHVWLLPLARALAGSPGITLDGLGGGVFFGGAFPPRRGPGGGQRGRKAQLLRYLRSAPGLLRPEAEAQLEERTRAGFDALVAHLRGHREVDALTAYLTRTLPGISLGPYGLVSAASAVATPFLDPEVVAASVRIPPEERRDRALYPALIERWSPTLAQLPTIVEPGPRHRRRPRRSSSLSTAALVRQRLTSHPAGDLLAPALRDADVTVWQRHLHSHADQHLLRSLWLLAGWLDRYHPSCDGLDALLQPTG